MINQFENQEPNLVLGRVADKLNRPLAGLVVRAYDKDMRTAELLGESVTDKEGKYEITWLHSQLSGRGRKEADLVMKVFTREKQTQLFISNIDEVRFNASPREEINITIAQAIKPEVVEYDYLLREVGFLAGKVAINDLQESEEHRDITFLSKEMEIPAEKIEHLVVAHRLGSESNMDAAFFYALLREKTLLKNDLAKTFHARLFIDINTETLPLLYDVALADSKMVKRDIEAAVKKLTVPARLVKELKRNLEQLEQYKQKAEEYYKNEHPRKVLNILGRFVMEEKLTEIGKLFEENKNDINTFLQKITAASFFKTDEKANDAKTALALGELLGFDEAIISQVKELQKIKKPEDVKKIAAFNKADWRDVLTKSADKLNLAGKPINKKLISLHASSLARKLEKEFPTVAFAAQLRREKKAVLRNQKEITALFAKNEDFDLQNTNIDLFLKSKKMTAKKHEAMREELKSVQRVFKLVPHYGKTNALLGQKIHSAQSIAAVGETRFIKEIAPKAGIKTEEAKEIFYRAERTTTAAMLIVGELQDTVRAMDINAIETSSLAMKLEAVSKDFPNLKSLFKLTDVCACEHCRSVYSPAAYLVEILQFLDKRSVTDLTTIPPTTAHLAKDVLFERRPDLGDIDLGCENANTPLPYIDLVCELLEEAVAPDAGVAYSGVLSAGANPLVGKVSNDLLTALQTAGMPVTSQAQIFATEISSGSSDTLPHYLRDKKAVCKIVHTGGNNYTVFRLRQTLSTAEELAAAPEYVNASAYTELGGQSYAFKLPFDLIHTEAKAYFERFDISQAKLMRDFQSAGVPVEASIAAEHLGLTDAERLLIVTPDPANQKKYWNTTSANASDEMKVVDTFLTKTGITYEEMEILLLLKFVDPAGNLFIRHNDISSCDTEQMEIVNLDDAALDRIHRFLRMQKKTGWTFELLDEIISQNKLGNGKLDTADDNGNGINNGDECLIKAAGLLAISEETGIKLDELTGFYGDIPHKIIKEDTPKPLYQNIFLNKAKNGFVDEALQPEKVDASQLLSSVLNSLSVCLQISESDLGKLLPMLPDGNLTFANLSYLFAASRLMRKLNLKIDDFITLSKLTGINIQDSPAQTLKFAKAVKDSQKLPFKPVDIQFMLRHEAANLSDREIKDAKIKQFLEKLQADYQKAFTSNKSPFDSNLAANEQKEALQSMLSKLPEVGEEDVKKIIKFIDRDWTSVIDAKTFVDDKFGNLFDTTIVKNGLDVLAAIPAGNDFSAESQGLIKAWLDTISAYQFLKEKNDRMAQSLITTFKTNVDLVNLVLKYAQLRQPAPGIDLLSDLLLSDTLIDQINAVPILPAITEITFPKQYQVLRLLHKLLPFIDSFKLESQEIGWYFQHNMDLGWFLWEGIPYQVGQTALDYSQLAAFAEMLSLAKQMTAVPNPADAENPITFLSVAEMLLTGSMATRNEFIEKFSLLTGFAKEDVDALDAHLFAVWSLNNYRNPETWRSVEKCVDYLRKLGSTVIQVKEFIKPVLTSMDANTLRMALKTRYDEDTWLGTLKEIMDAIRPQKRNALVAYLLAANPEMKDQNDLYDYFLVDVEMEACMPSSRIVQAHGTIQLFVQRCLMGLEPKAAADVNNDKSWEQWKWMKNYRVWEANRKVFLYPENWIEAELRDDKSFLFAELENELLQNELTEFTAEEALIKYLEKLDNIAFLEVVATWYQSDIKIMHVFARTKGGDPDIYYYRRFEQERYWTPWEKVELDITGDHLLAFVRNNRLSLAWPVFTEEPDPGQGATVPDQSNITTEQSVNKPRKKLKIQLAISEFANKKWQPKKISKDAIKTPPDTDPNDPIYTDQDIPRENLKFFYNELAEQVVIFNTILVDVEVLAGAFDLTGCKGYPELAPAKAFTLDFIPKFRDTNLSDQRYKELDKDKTNDLTALNVHSILTNKIDEILHQTPGIFRLTYPHQMTKIDLVALLLEYLLMFAYEGTNYSLVNMRGRYLKLPLGTLLPYFEEDSRHAYVIIPGFYENKKEGESGDTVFVSRTGSNVLQLIEDIAALFKKYMAKYAANPGQDINALQQELIADNEYQRIVAELKVYRSLRYGEQFKNMYHPLVCALRTTLYKQGIPELMKRDTQLQKTQFDFEKYYDPNTDIVPKTYLVRGTAADTFSYPIEDLDFGSDGSYSEYNWELFFHVPFLLATRLTKNQRFEEAMTWFHYMFNPTGALEGTIPQKYWVTKPFYLTQSSDYINQRIDTLLYKIADPNTPERADLEFAIDQWRNKPFKPHVVARFRPVAYQKALLMKYIDNLTEWGDYLFRQDTMESIVQATQMYILADKLLGPKPRNIPPAIKAPYETYNQIEGKLDAFGNALIDLENILPDLSALPEGGAELPPAPITLSMLYFCIPQNDKMLEYWDRIADRLFKIRHCQNIDGVERSLALFAPPIDPGMLVRATAAGLDISSILAGINAPAPYYRFNVLSQKATELAQEVRGLGSSLLQALEKKDVEVMSLLRSELEIRVLNAVTDMKTLQINEAKEQIEVLKRTKLVTEERNKYYSNIQKIISREQLNLDKLSESQDYQQDAQIVRTIAGALALIPEFHVGVSGFGGSPEVVLQLGGSALSRATTIGADILNILGSVASYQANRASIFGGYDRRFDDWKLQERLAKKELFSIEKQIAAAEIRKEIAETDLRNHELQIENAKKTDEFMRSKFTNKELYDWMIGQISSVYFRAYQLAHDFAKKAERSYRFELGNDDAFISYGYWDSLKKGLQSADHLFHDIKRMETGYLDKNKREYELTKHVSLAMLDPLALVKLRASGSCNFDVPEALFDLDHAGHYFRRMKSVSLSLPCIAGPYTSVSAKLSLVRNNYRKNTNPQNLATTGYTEDPAGNDERFVYNVGAIQSIAASNSQNDSGVFELNFRDERYLPFEGTGAISSWRLELPKKELSQFDYETISDVIVHIKYTAREGGSTIKGLAETALKDRLAEIKQQLSQTGLHVAINMKHDLPNEWHLLKQNGTIDLKIDKSRLPYMAQTMVAAIENVVLIAKVKNNPSNYSVNIDGGAVNLARIDVWKLCRGNNVGISLDTSFQLSIAPAQLGDLEDFMMIVKYSF